MTTNSIETFNTTAELRQLNKQKVWEALQTERNQSRFEIGRKTMLGDIEAQRRLSDLINEDKAVITGSRKHFKRDVSLYSVKEQLSMFNEKKLTLKAWLKTNHADIFEQWEKLNK